MWWIIGSLIGTAWNIHEEKKNPELWAKRQKEGQRAIVGCLVFLALAAAAFIGLLIYAAFLPDAPPSDN